jgi:phenylacetate-coenzyme A ligase PaaK-like adenylate-forming protein
VRPPFDAWLTGSAAFDVALAARSPPEANAARARRRLVAFLDAARRGSALVRRLLDGRAPADVRLADLAPTHKRDLMAAFDEWVGDPAIERASLRRFLDDPRRIGEAYLGRYLAWESSGSSGVPAMFVQDAAALAAYDALEAMRRPDWSRPRPWLDPWGVGDTTVFVGATDGHFASNVSLARLRRLNPWLRESLHAVSFLQPLESLCRALEVRRPTIVATYPTQAVVLAEERLAGRLDIAPREVWTGGETLTETMRRRIERAFSCRVVNSYGSSEFLTLASDCARGCLHLNSDWALLEPVDAEGRPVDPGSVGATTLLTNLANVVQPIVRYDIGDRVMLRPERCACGSPLPVIDVEGRSDDVLRLPGRDGRTVTLLPLALGTVVEEEAHLFDYQVIQRAARRLELRTGLAGAAADGLLSAARTALLAFIERQGGHRIAIECRAGAPAIVGRSGKSPRVVARLSAP